MSSLPDSRLRAWLHAGRPRTLPLALSGIVLGSLLAAAAGRFRWETTLLGMLTALFLQIFSNLANDYGDSVHGADHAERRGPKRAVQSGIISGKAMLRGMVVCALAALTSGLLLIFTSFSLREASSILLFAVLGVMSLAAALKYTYGKNPYGYAGLGDVFVWGFFGPVAVAGTYFLHTHRWDADILLPASSIGMFSTAVLNVNNIRDIDSDRTAGKRSIPVRIGARNAKIYHILLLTLGWATAFAYFLGHFSAPRSYLCFLSLPLFAETAIGISKQNTPEKIDPYLKKTAFATLLFALTFGLGIFL